MASHMRFETFTLLSGLMRKKRRRIFQEWESQRH